MRSSNGRRACAPAATRWTYPLSVFARYEAKHRTLVDPRQGNVALMVPATRTGIAARNLATRLWPAAATAGRLRNLLTSTATASP
ncbi:hypothetical protein [Nonomuraea rosea]|uniref:hypothetical protein n=1 Tax=Nonomuraea rosea TaxID=638574 RepID=UPI0031E69949